jgi:hypothetical protein
LTTSASVTLSEVFDAVTRHRTTLAPETAGYLVLALADQLTSAPRAFDSRKCGILVDGGGLLIHPSAPAPSADAERTLRRLLQSLLRITSGTSPALATVAGLPPRGEVSMLIGELESALIPVNRGAAKRALSRLARDTLRARAEGALSEGEILIELEQAPDPQPHPLEVAPLQPPAQVAREGAPRSRSEVSTGGGPARMPAVSEPLPFDLSPSPTDRIETRSPSPPPAGPLRTPLPHSEAPVFTEEEPVTAKTDPPPEAFEDEVSTGRAPAVPPSDPRPDSLADVDQLLATSNRSAARVGEGPRRGDPEAPRASSSGVDDLLTRFASAEARGDRRVSRDLRRMVDVDATPTPAAAPSSIRARAQSAPPEAPFEQSPELATKTPPPRAPLSFGSLEVPKPSRRSVFALAALLAAAGVAAAVLWRAQPGSLSGRTADVVEAERQVAGAAAASAAAQASAGACRATIVVDDLAPSAEVLVRAGVAPTDLERVPVGARLEFVALLDGFAPRRSVIPAGASWDSVHGKPRFELAIQLEKSRAKPGALDPWPPAEPGSTVGGQGSPGTVHVVTTPRGAEVWMVAGMGPEAKLESLPCGVGIDLLVAGALGAQPYRRRLRVEAAQLTPEGSQRTVTTHTSGRPPPGN